MKKYLFDSNIFIVSKDKFYKPEFIMFFWDWLLEGHRQGYFYSIDHVKRELEKGKEGDFLEKFANDNPDFFLKTNPSREYKELMQWANTEWCEECKAIDLVKRDAARERFSNFNYADSWLIAYASENDFEIITHETSAPQKISEIKLPDAAKIMGVKCHTLFEVMSLHAHDNLKFKSDDILP